MKQTEVIVHINEKEFVFYFSLDKEVFMKLWDNRIPAVGYFSHADRMGNEIIINPSHCGVIEMAEVNA